MKTKIYLTIPIVFLLFAKHNSFAQKVNNEFQSRTELDLSFKPIKKVKISISPQLRFEDDFSLDKYLLEGELEYKALKLFAFGAKYGLVGNIRNEKETEYFNRFAFFSKMEKEIGRFEPSLRLMFSNYADDDVNDKKFMRYKAGLKYDIRECKITPFVAFQLFHDLVEGGLYKNCYAVGANYKLFKNNNLGVAYKFDYYNTEYLNKHIICLGYKIKF